MNYDRFLTRVWDKREKKMIYPGDKIGTDKDVLVAVTNDRLIITGDENPNFLGFWKFGDRFVPMQCTGLKDKNGKLIYEGDIIQDSGDSSKYLIYWREEYYGFLAKCLDETLDLSLDNFRYSEVFGSDVNIIGNCWENPELLEQDK